MAIGSGAFPLVAWRFSCWKSIVFLSDPFFLVQMTMRWHQVSGVPRGTCSMTPSLTSRSRPAFTSSCQWMGMAMGVWQGLGMAVGSMLRLRGGA